MACTFILNFYKRTNETNPLINILNQILTGGLGNVKVTSALSPPRTLIISSLDKANSTKMSFDFWIFRVFII